MKIIDDEMDDGGENLDIGIMQAKQQDKEIIYHAMLGHDLTEVYGSERLKLTANREFLRQIMSTDVSEVFSPERVTTVCKQYGLVPGEAMDIKNGYDFDLVSDQKKAWDSIIKDKPKLVIGSPPCTFFSRLQELNKYMYRNDELWMAKFSEGIEQAKRYVRFCVKLYNHQREHGRYFLHEHPWLATSWGLVEIENLLKKSDVQRVRTDMCQFGMTSRTGPVGSALGPVLKPTGFLTNSPHIARELSKRCPKLHEHVPLVGGRAAAAAIYPHRLCCAICKGLAAQLAEDRNSIGSTYMSPGQRP